MFSQINKNNSKSFFKSQVNFPFKPTKKRRKKIEIFKYFYSDYGFIYQYEINLLKKDYGYIKGV